MAARRVTVFGGSGFVGRYLVRRLAARGDVVTVAVRDPEAAAFLKPMGDPGQIVPVQANIRDDASVAAALTGAEAVVNLVGILYESGSQAFEAVHRHGAARVAKLAKAAGATRFVQMSAIGADPSSPSVYGRTKAAGEVAAREQFPGASVVRPSIVFGPEDDFFNRFAALARLLPALPLYGGGRTRFQPVYVGDVAEAIVRILDDPETRGRTYELGGPREYTFKELMELLLAEIGRRRVLLPLPFFVADMQAFFLERLPKPPLTRDQVNLLQRDNVVAESALALADLGITATGVEAILPTYMVRFRRRGQWSRIGAA